MKNVDHNVIIDKKHRNSMKISLPLKQEIFSVTEVFALVPLVSIHVSPASLIQLPKSGQI